MTERDADIEPFRGKAICCDCGGELGWTPLKIMPGAFYVCAPCETVGLATGTLIRPEEFFGEWELFDESGSRIIVER